MKVKKKAERQHDAPAMVKAIVLIRLAMDELEDLRQAHGEACECYACGDVEGATWSLGRCAGGFESLTHVSDKYTESVAEAVREVLDANVGDSADPGIIVDDEYFKEETKAIRSGSAMLTAK